MTTRGSGSRAIRTCRPSERTFDRQFRTECIAPPGGPGDPYFLGTSTNDEYNPPGYINHDVTLFKNFAIGSRVLQFRAELYNAFNLTQYRGRRSGCGVQLRAPACMTDTNFGRVTGVRGSTNRVIQLGVRFRF